MDIRSPPQTSAQSSPLLDWVVAAEDAVGVVAALDRPQTLERRGLIERIRCDRMLGEVDVLRTGVNPRANRKAESRAALRTGMDLASACGAKPLAERARSELRASGIRARRTALSGPGSLTESERRVVDLAVLGRTNREIATELFVTIKTVEVHLSSSYRKLNVKGRRQLATVMEPAA